MRRSRLPHVGDVRTRPRGADAHGERPERFMRGNRFMLRAMLQCGKTGRAGPLPVGQRFHARNSAAERLLFAGEMPCVAGALTDILKKMG
jgi:hypothetical protein